MDKIKEFYDRFEAIQLTYSGKQTNWSEKMQELWSLYNEIYNFRCQSSKHSPFYEYVRRKLQEDIHDEYQRVMELTLRKED